MTAIKNLVHDDSKAAKLCAKSGGVKALRQALKKIESSVDIQSLVDNPTVWLPYLIDHVRLAKVASRKALIIANDYDDITHPWRSLMSSKDNANAMKEVLERAGFDVHMLVNISKKQVITAIKRFSSLLSSGILAWFTFMVSVAASAVSISLDRLMYLRFLEIPKWCPICTRLKT